jgi:ribosomal-protein-alanine N-acetyltransferase
MSAGRDVSTGASETLIRALDARDIPAVLAILQGSPEAASWSQESLLQLESVGQSARVAERNGVVAGFLIGRSAADEFEILNMAVSSAQRRRGIGSKLLSFALNSAREGGVVRVYLEVRASNEAAITLYMGHGFRECGRRPRYYGNPIEDALLMSLELA